MKGSDAYITAFNALSCGEGKLLAEAKKAWVASSLEGPTPEYVVRSLLLYRQAGLPGLELEWGSLRSSQLLDGLDCDQAAKEAIDVFRFGRNTVARWLLGEVGVGDAYAAVRQTPDVEEG